MLLVISIGLAPEGELPFDVLRLQTRSMIREELRISAYLGHTRAFLGLSSMCERA
jgi:hypothetical protein